MDTRIETILNESNLNWSVRTEPIKTASGIILDGYTAIIRNDNDNPLSVRSDSYYPFQNEELIELLDRVSGQTGLKIHKGGFFGQGQKVYIQLKSNDLSLNGDRIEGYLTGINSFDGSTSLAFGPSNITISCQNTFFAAFREMNSKVRHTKNMVIRVDEICKSLEGVIEEEKKVFSNIVKLSETRFTNVTKDKVTRHLFNIDKNVDLEKIDDISGKTRNKLSRFYVDLDGELKDKGDNMWGLFSGITKFTTHHLNKEMDRNTENKMFGTYGTREKQIFNQLVELV
jgi:phage/plasmid-like protein (TIGR03299 family)